MAIRGSWAPPPGGRWVALDRGGRERAYLLRLPDRALGGGPVPLIVELHGRGIDPLAFDRLTGLGAHAGDVGWALALPVAVGELWNDGRRPARPGPDDVGFLRAVIDDACRDDAVDPRRVYVVGMSNGAAMAARLVAAHADAVAAVAQVAGTVANVLAATWSPSRPVPLLQIHGSADPYAPYAAGAPQSTRARLIQRDLLEPALGVDEWADLVVARNGADPEPEAWELPPDTTVRRWRGASPDRDVVFYRIDGGGHTWPGSADPLPPILFGRTTRTFDATHVIREFFSAHLGPA